MLCGGFGGATGVTLSHVLMRKKKEFRRGFWPKSIILLKGLWPETRILLEGIWPTKWIWLQGFFSENVYSVERAPAENFYSVYEGGVWPETVLWEATAQTKCFVKTCFAGKEISLSGLWPKTTICSTEF